MKPLGQGEQLGLASPLRYAATQSGKTKSPSNKEAGLDAIYQPGSPRGGTEKNFFLDIPFHRMSAKAISRQLCRSNRWLVPARACEADHEPQEKPASAP